MGRGAWWATVHRVAKSDMIEATLAHMHTHTHTQYTAKAQYMRAIVSIIIYI